MHTKRRRHQRVNIRALVITFLAIVLIGGGGVGGHYIRKKSIAARAVSEARAAATKGDWSEACHQYRLYLDKYPNDADVLEKYGVALLMQPLNVDTVMAAISVFSRLNRLKPDDELSFKRLVSLYTSVQNFDEIARAASKRLERKPGDPKLIITLAQALVSKNYPDEATKKLTGKDGLLERIKGKREYCTEYAEACRLLSTMAARPDTDTGWHQARDWLNRAVADCPDTPEAFMHRARFLRTSRSAASQPVAQRLSIARADLERASSLKPADPRVRLALSEEWLAHNEPARAKAELDAAGSIDAESMRQYFIDPEDWTAARFIQMAEIALRDPTAPDLAALADQAVDQLTHARQRLAVLPSAVKLYVAAKRGAEAQRYLDEYVEKMKGAQQSPEVKSRIGILSAMVAWMRGRPYDVIQALEPVVALDPGNGPAWKQLADSYNRTDQPARAITAMENFLRVQPLDPDGIHQAALLYMRQHRWGSALEVLNRIVPARKYKPDELSPDTLELVLMRIEAAANDAVDQPVDASGALEALAQELGELRKAYPDRCEVAMLQATVATYLNHSDRAAAILSQAIKDCKNPSAAELQLAKLYAGMRKPEEAIAVAQKACQEHPELASTWQTLAETQRAAGKRDEARRTLQSALEAVKNPADQRDIKVTLGMLEVASGNPSAGVKLLTEVAGTDRLPDGKVRPDGAAVRIRSLLLTVQEILTDQPRATKFVDEIRQIEGDSGLLWQMNTAAVRLADPDWRSHQQEIIELLKHCTEGDPRWSRPAIMLGRVYQELNSPDRAEAVYRRVIGVNPAALDVADQLLNLLAARNRLDESKAVLDQLSANARMLTPLRAGVAVAAGDLNRAIDELDRQVADNPRDVNARVLLARAVYQKDKNFEAASKYLNEAESAAPDSLLVPGTRADLLFQARRNDEAHRVLDDMVAQKKSFDAYYMRGALLAKLGDFEQAERDFKQLSRMRADGLGYELLGKFYVDFKRMDDAVAALQTGAEAHPESEPLQRELIKALLVRSKGDDRARAEERLNQVENARRAAKRPEDPDLLWVEARVQIAKNTAESLERARKLLEQLLKIEPTHIDAYLALADLAIGRDDMAAAREFIVRALGVNPRDSRLRLARAEIERAAGNAVMAQEIVSQLVRDEKTNLKAFTLLGSLALSSNDRRALEAVRPRLEEGIAASPDNEALRLMQAAVLVALEQPGHAIESLEAFQHSKAGERSIGTMVALADVYRTTKEFAKAQEWLDHGKDIQADHPSLLNGQLRLWSAQKNFDQIIKFMNDYRAAHQTNPDVIHTAAIVLIREGGEAYTKDAVSVLEYGISVAPRVMPMYLSLALLSYQSREFDRAISIYQKVLDIAPHNVQALNDLAWIYTDVKHDHKKAKELADKGIKIDPDSPHLRDTRGVTLTHLGNHKDAQEDFRRAVEILRERAGGSADLARALLQLARCQVRLKNYPAARASVNEALDIDKKKNVLTANERTEITGILARSPSGK